MNKSVLGGMVVALVLILVAVVYFEQDGVVPNVSENSQVVASTTVAKEPFDENYFNEEEAVLATKTYIQILQRMNYINFDNSKDATEISGLIMSMTAEAMKDKADLDNLIFKAKEMKASKIMGVSVTGLSIETALMQLVIAHDDYIQFLRTVDEQTADLAEFQYQMAQFQSSTKSAYMAMAENATLFHYTLLDLSETEGVPAKWGISEASRKDLLNEIDLRFEDIFIQDDLQYKETQTRDVTVFLAKSLKEFLEVEM
jgi:hypothetical protein